MVPVVVPAGVVVVPAGVGAEVAPLVPEVFAGVAPGAEAGSDVSGVGSGGSGFDRMPASISFNPASDWLFLNLYQVVRLSIQTGF